MSVSGMFSPFFGGGAEFSSYNLAKWLCAQGHEVGVLTTAPTPQDVMEGELMDGLYYWRVHMPRSYPVHHPGKWWQKPVWHLQDHLDPANRRIAARVLDAFKPDFVNLHILQGLGLNILNEIAARRIPALYFQHDLGLVCLKRSMFKDGRDCPGQCAPCRISSRYQEKLLAQMPKLTICSPSRANLDKIAKYFPLAKYHDRATLNANVFPKPTVEREESAAPRLLYVGRLHVTKGVDLLLEVCAKLIADHPFHLTVVGGGPDEERLRQRYACLPWVTFTGNVAQADVSNYMLNADLLCFPSIWAEPLGGVAVHAFTLGVPVLGSDTGGIPEVVRHDENGMLVPPGDAEKWEAALRFILENPAELERWRRFADGDRQRFSQDNLAKAIYAIIEETMARPSRTGPVPPC